MILEIKKVKRCRNGAYGNFLLQGRTRALITVSLKLNQLLAEYGATLLHELLHFWMTMMRREGFKMNDRREHQFIYAVEKKIINEMKKYGRKK